MKRLICLTLIVVFMPTYLFVSSAQISGQSPTPGPQEHEKDGSEEDKVYTYKEVDQKAQIKNKMEHLPRLKSDCPAMAKASLRAILHKSGKVIEVTLIKGAGCSYDKEAIKAVRKLKFIPAMKDGHPVSQYLDIEYETSY